MAAPTPAQSLLDPYAALGVERNASDDEIKLAYRKLALKLHPDKPGGNEELFKRVTTAYKILSDVEARRLFDAKGYEGLEKAGKEGFDVDLSTLSVFSYHFAAMASGMGLKFKTHVAPAVIESACLGKAIRRPLPFNVAVTDKVAKQAAIFFEVVVTEEAATNGIVIKLTAPAGAKLKLLRFSVAAAGHRNLEPVGQEDTAPMGKKEGVMAAFFFLKTFDTMTLDAPPSPIDLRDDPLAGVFGRLKNLKVREDRELRAGTHVFAVYGDNFYGSTNFTLCALELSLESAAAEPPVCVGWINELRSAETALCAKRAELVSFETQFRAAKAAFHAAVERFNKEDAELRELVERRERAYGAFLPPPPPTPLPPPPAPVLQSTGPAIVQVQELAVSIGATVSSWFTASKPLAPGMPPRPIRSEMDDTGMPAMDRPTSAMPPTETTGMGDAGPH